MEGENLENKDRRFDHLRQLRAWSDEVPEEILRGSTGDKPPEFKVRKNWWMAVMGDLYFLTEYGVLPEDLLKEIKDFEDKFSGKDSDFPTRLTTERDLAEANALIDKILESQK